MNLPQGAQSISTYIVSKASADANNVGKDRGHSQSLLINLKYIMNLLCKKKKKKKKREREKEQISSSYYEPIKYQTRALELE